MHIVLVCYAAPEVNPELTLPSRNPYIGLLNFILLMHYKLQLL